MIVPYEGILVAAYVFSNPTIQINFGDLGQQIVNFYGPQALFSWTNLAPALDSTATKLHQPVVEVLMVLHLHLGRQYNPPRAQAQ